MNKTQRNSIIKEGNFKVYEDTTDLLLHPEYNK